MGAQISAVTGELIGQTMVTCGCQAAMGFEKSAEAVIRSADIQPWPAKTLIRERLERQVELSKRCALRFVPVRDGFNHFCDKIGRFSGMSKSVFVETAKNLIGTKSLLHKGADDELLCEVFDSIDYDTNGDLSVGEWAGGLTVYFEGTQDQKTQVLFEMLDRDHNGDLCKTEMKEYLKPLVKAMTPPEAAALRPLLLQHAADEIFNAVDVNNDGKCSSLEFQQWRKTHSLLDELVRVIEAEVYRIWLEHKMKSPAKDAAAVESLRHTEVRNSIYG